MTHSSSRHLLIEPSSPRDFDFFVGNWLVHHRRLKGRLVGSSEWEAFDGQCACHKILGGFGNIDDNILYLPAGTYRAATLRSSDESLRKWSIWWLDARSPSALDVPVVGAFENGTGTFLANDSLEGKPIVVRFLWLQSADGKPRWEQAFSPDDGKTWETNWTMEFTPLVESA